MDAGKRLKAKTGWDYNTGTYVFGFSALPGGYRTSVVFSGMGASGRWWTSTEYNSTKALSRILVYSSNKIFRGDYNKPTNGYNVRCMKD